MKKKKKKNIFFILHFNVFNPLRFVKEEEREKKEHQWNLLYFVCKDNCIKKQWWWWWWRRNSGKQIIDLRNLFWVLWFGLFHHLFSYFFFVIVFIIYLWWCLMPFLHQIKMMKKRFFQIFTNKYIIHFPWDQISESER